MYYLIILVFAVGVLIFMTILPLLFSNRANENTSTDKRIDVRARLITVALPAPYYGTVTGYHLFIVYTDVGGRQSICEAIPVDPNTDRMPPKSDLTSNHRDLLTRGYCHPYVPGTATNDANAPSVTAATVKAKEAYDCFVKETAAFNAADIPYNLTTGPNSNSYVRTLLDHCKVPAVKPPAAVLTPGWDVSIRLER